MKVAIAHDWITNFAGSVRVAYEMHKMYPQAPIFTSVYNPDAAPQFKDADVRTSFIQKIPLAKRKHQYFPTLRQKAFERIDFSDYDLVLSSSGSEAKGIITSDNTFHINYCHSPTHYYWRNYQEYIAAPGFGRLDPLARAALKQKIKKARKWDLKAAKRPDVMIANSHFIQAQIKKYYDRDSVVIHPPVNIDRFKNAPDKKRSGFVIVGRQVPFKRIDLAVAACTKLNVPLAVVGSGSENEKLRAMAGDSVKFYTKVGDQELVNFYASAEGFLFPNEEDFGIVAAEALAAGTPVIAYDEGGSRDIVKEGETGLFFKEQSPEALAKAIKNFQKTDWDHKAIKQSAKTFSRSRFQKELKGLINKSLQ